MVWVLEDFGVHEVNNIAKQLRKYGIEYEVIKIDIIDHEGRNTKTRKAVIERHHIEKLLECVKGKPKHYSRDRFIEKLEKILRDNFT